MWKFASGEASSSFFIFCEGESGWALADVSLVEEGWGPGRGRWSGHSLSWLLLPFGHSCSAVFFRKKVIFIYFVFWL